jgi:hypothetical protein
MESKPTGSGASPGKAGRGAAYLLGPHLLLGTWLMVLPDHFAFTANQIVTLIHVVLALVTFPIAAWWVFVHVRRMRPSRARSSTVSTWSRRLLTYATVLAAVSGFIVLRGGTIVKLAPLHTWCGVAVGVPLAWHLWLSRRRFGAVLSVGLLLAATGGAAVAKRALVPQPISPNVPAFAYETRPTELYDSANFCGECHTQQFKDWKHTIHSTTLDQPEARTRFKDASRLSMVDLKQLGYLEKHDAEAAEFFESPEGCAQCHTPASFYGDDQTPIELAKGVVSEGVTCTFCHTLRDVRGDASLLGISEKLKGLQNRAPFTAESIRLFPYYVSAPETVRRYIGQDSSNTWLHKVGNWLIRWRPEMHSHDYHSEILNTSKVCLGCHGFGLDAPAIFPKSYHAWEKSTFATGDPKTQVECQDCHMVRHITGKPVKEPGQLVPWGPERGQARSHLVLGGNVRGAEALNDQEMALLEHEVAKLGVSLSLVRTRQEGETLFVTAAVKSQLIGHYFPAMDSGVRYAWIHLIALDARGKQVAASPVVHDAKDMLGPSPIIYRSSRCFDPKTMPQCDTLVYPLSTREFEGRITLPANARPVVSVKAELYESLDPVAISEATLPLTRTAALDPELR